MEIDLFGFPAFVDEVTEGRGVEGGLVLEFGREVDTVVLADVTDSTRRELLSFGGDAHSVKDMTAGGQVSGKGAW